MKQYSEFSSDEGAQHASEQQSAKQAAQEFATAEELLRYEAANTSVPPSIVQRLAKSTAELPTPSRSWWQRFFGGSKS